MYQPGDTIRLRMYLPPRDTFKGYERWLTPNDTTPKVHGSSLIHSDQDLIEVLCSADSEAAMLLRKHYTLEPTNPCCNNLGYFSGLCVGCGSPAS